MRTRAQTLSFPTKILSSPHPKRPRTCRGKELLTDRLSKLPDAIIICILLMLTMKEAGRTSVLAKRWRYVWVYSLPVLNFDASDTLDKLMLGDKLLEVEKPRYLSWVNKVVGSYKGPIIDEFRVAFDLTMSSRHSIDNWVKFAMEKKVKRLELNLSPDDERVGHSRSYTFRGLPICYSLTSLHLACVNVTSKVIENCLRSCPSLESLSVKGSRLLGSLRVAGETLNLKYLEICSCFEMKHIEICAPNLESFKYFGPKIGVLFKSTPKLAKLSMGGNCGKYVTNNFLEISSYLSQLEALTLDLQYSNVKDVMKSVDQFTQCKKLEQLEVKVYPNFYEDLFCFVPLIKACPNLHKFVLKLGRCGLGYERNFVGVKTEAFPHANLKIVEIVGFVGHAIDIEFIMYLIENSVALEKIVINTCRPDYVGTPWELEVNHRRKKALKQTEKLRTKLKLGIDFIVL